MMKWISGWGYRECDFSLFPIDAENETQRLWFYNNLNSDTVRLRFSNRYGRYKLPIEQVMIATCTEDGVLIPDTSVKVFFDKNEKVLLEKGEIRYSDLIPFRAKAGTWISISIYIKEKVRITSAISSQSTYITRMCCKKNGNYCDTSVVSGERFLDDAKAFLELKPLYNIVAAALTQADFLCQNAENITAVTVFGDSITQHGNWSEALTRRLYELKPAGVAVVNRGICGNRVLHDASIRSIFGAYFGEAALERFEDDVYDSVNGKVDCIIIEEGVNDIIQPFDNTCPQYEKVTANEILEGYRKMVEIAHKHSVKVLGATIMPFAGFNQVWNQETEQRRCKVNNAIMNGGIFDQTLDFAEIVCDKDNPFKLAEQYNCGDNLHPNVAGGEAIARAIDLSAIFPAERN